MTTRTTKSVHTLSNGQELKVLSGTGRDMINAERVAPKGSSMGMAMALTASKILIDDKPVSFDEFADLDQDLIEEIIVLVNEKPEKKEENFTSAPRT
jgi:hypothetical protein